jgi:hypothetical protein
MLRSTFFIQECPTCGRRVEVRVEYLGREVVCDHCQGRFSASDPNCVGSRYTSTFGADLMTRADRLLEAIDAQRSRSH